MAGHIVLDLSLLRPERTIYNALQTGKQVIICTLFGILTMAFWFLAWRTVRLSTPQHHVAVTWSLWMVCSFGLLASSFLLVYYPIPAHKHHADKLL